MTLTIGSLFSGIGGLELGLERAGLGPVVWQVEKDAYCRAVLTKHWPDVTRYDDVQTVGAHNLQPVDVICGGFPCQDVSASGRRAGVIIGARSGLWFEYSRIIRELRPRYVIVENVAGLLTLGLDAVLGELAACGYDAEWDCVPASAVGAPHQRDRIFVVAYPQGHGLTQRGAWQKGLYAVATGGEWLWGEPRRSGADDGTGAVADVEYDGLAQRRRTRPARVDGGQRSGVSGALPSGGELEALSLLADIDDQRGEGIIARGNDAEVGPVSGERPTGLRDRAWGNRAWLSEPDVVRVVHGLPQRAQRIKALGNAVVPQVAEVVGRVVMELERQRLEGAA